MSEINYFNFFTMHDVAANARWVSMWLVLIDYIYVIFVCIKNYIKWSLLNHLYIVRGDSINKLKKSYFQIGPFYSLQCTSIGAVSSHLYVHTITLTSTTHFHMDIIYHINRSGLITSFCTYNHASFDFWWLKFSLSHQCLDVD
jgi:hypothetical protein